MYVNIFYLKKFWLVKRVIIAVLFCIIRENINMTKSECRSNVVILKNVQLYIIPFDPLLQFN